MVCVAEGSLVLFGYGNCGVVYRKTIRELDAARRARSVFVGSQNVKADLNILLLSGSVWQ